jgi:hypothetical protein
MVNYIQTENPSSKNPKSKMLQNPKPFLSVGVQKVLYFGAFPTLHWDFICKYSKI